ncbi:MAG: type II toxin-antitoxin system VapC family toxin [Betaproteobacteria bacterium]|nr:type II toxin-antitoxin system VapC family toxin [Betaproteobacteria bacterium]
MDTSVLVAAHTREPHTAPAQAWLSENTDELILTTWTLVECDSALAIKRRRGELDEAAQIAASIDIEAFAARHAPLFIPTEADYQRAREFCRQAASGLRAGDALHLAVALRLEASHLATLDQVLAANAIQQGLAVALILR